MKLELLSLTENEDGSADLEVDVDEEAKKLLLQVGLEALIIRAIERYKDKSNES
jgi:hypothetical protein